MKLPDKYYDVLKWIVLLCIPAIATAYVGLAEVWGLPLANEISKTANVICVFLGSIIGISTAEYRKDKLNSTDKE